MSAGLRTLVWLLLGLAPIVYLWAIGHPAIIDRPRAQVIWDRHSPWHLFAPLAYAAVGQLLGAYGMLCGVLVALAWELANRFPLDRGGGHFELSDLVFGFIGSAAGVMLAALLGASGP